MSVEKTAGVVAGDAQELVAGRRGFLGHKVAAVVPDSVPHILPGWVVGDAGYLAD